MSQTVVIAERFNGLPGSAHGGLACGLFAAQAAGLRGERFNTVSLHAPVPLNWPLQFRPAGRRVSVWAGDTLVASVSVSEEPIRLVPFAPPELIAEAERGYVSEQQHPFPGCFACGPLRAGNGGLGLAPGPLPGRPGATGCFWAPDASLGASPGEQLPEAFAWAAMDCPGGWTAALSQAPMVLSRFTASVTGAPVAGATYVIVGERDKIDEHLLTTTTALYHLDGTIIGRAMARWNRIASDASRH